MAARCFPDSLLATRDTTELARPYAFESLSIPTDLGASYDEMQLRMGES